MKCFFCGGFVRQPKKLGERYQCACGASYTVCRESEEADTVFSLHQEILGEDFLNLPAGTPLLQIRREVFSEEGGERKVIIFARKAEEE